MANFHLNFKVFGRSKGQSAVAAAAYRAGMLGKPMLDEETGLISNFSAKAGVISSKIYLPVGSPPAMQDRSKLWNEATRAERRVNSTLAREMEFSLPCEIDDASRARLIERVAMEIVARHGCAVDANQHQPSLKRWRQLDDTAEAKWVSKNHHVHLLMTTRVLSATGFGAKTRELDCRSSKQVEYWRARVATLINEAYKEAGLPHRLDHRSFKDRGILLAPQRHRGPGVIAMLRKGRSRDSYVLKRQLMQESQDQQRLKEVEQYREVVLEIERDRQAIQTLHDQMIDEKYAWFSTSSKFQPSTTIADTVKVPAQASDSLGDGIYITDFETAEQMGFLIIDQSEDHWVDLEEAEPPRYYQRE